MKKRGQLSIEFVITVGFALLMIIPLTILMYEQMTNAYKDVNGNQAFLIARRITDAANSVYYLGYPSTVTLRVYMPEGIKSINITRTEIAFVMETKSDIVSSAKVNLTGSLTSSSGSKYIKIAAIELTNLVNISEDVS